MVDGIGAQYAVLNAAKDIAAREVSAKVVAQKVASQNAVETKRELEKIANQKFNPETAGTSESMLGQVVSQEIDAQTSTPITAESTTERFNKLKNENNGSGLVYLDVLFATEDQVVSEALDIKQLISKDKENWEKRLLLLNQMMDLSQYLPPEDGGIGVDQIAETNSELIAKYNATLLEIG